MAIQTSSSSKRHALGETTQSTSLVSFQFAIFPLLLFGLEGPYGIEIATTSRSKNERLKL
ncbi:hypothetical protein ACE6H2_007290 [Prunus campanulata]